MAHSRDQTIANLEKRVAELEEIVQRLLSENLRLSAENKRLRSDNERFRSEVERLRANARKDNRQAGRFSRDTKKENPKRPGRKEGHESASRPVPDVTHEIVPVRLCACPTCGGDVVDVRTEPLYQTDIPEQPQPVVTRFEVEFGFCPFCEKTVKARDPRQVTDPTNVARVALGPNVLALLALLKDGYGMPFRKIGDFLERFFGLKLTPGGISQALDRVADKLMGTYEVIVRELRRSKIVYADETGWRINGETAWLWVFTNDKVTVYTIRRSRGADVIDDMLSDDFDGILMSDCLSSYLSYGGEKAKCLGHLIKDLAELERRQVGKSKRFARRALLLCRDAITLKTRKADMPADVYFAEAVGIVDGFLDLVAIRYRHPDSARLAARITKYMGEFLLFLEVDDLDPTNNLSERRLRAAVITRKISCGSRSDKGANRHSIIASVLATAKQHGLDFCSLVVRAILSLGHPVLDRAALDTG